MSEGYKIYREPVVGYVVTEHTSKHHGDYVGYGRVIPLVIRPTKPDDPFGFAIDLIEGDEIETSEHVVSCFPEYRNVWKLYVEWGSYIEPIGFEYPGYEDMDVDELAQRKIVELSEKK